MAEQLLHRAQILRRLQHVAGERMAQHVRVHLLGEAAALRPGGEALPNAAGGDARGRARRRTARFPQALPPENGFPASLERVARFLPTGTVRVFEPLPVTVTSPCAGSSLQVERDELAHAQSRRIEQLEHRAILNQQGSALVLRSPKPLRRLDGQAPLAAAGPPWARACPSTGLDSKPVMARKPAVLAAPGGEREREERGERPRECSIATIAPHLLGRLQLPQGFFPQTQEEHRARGRNSTTSRARSLRWCLSASSYSWIRASAVSSGCA